MVNKKVDAITIFLIGLCLFTFGLSSQEVISFEARFFLFAQEMWRHGFSWFPTTYQQPYPDYPGTATALSNVIAHLYGKVDKFTAVLPSAIASALTVVVTYQIGALHSRRWGWCAAIFLFFTLTFISEARTISLDQYVALITTCCFYLAEIFSRYNRRFLLVHRFEANRLGFFSLIALLLIVAFAFRGPIGLVIPSGVLCAYFLADKNIKDFFFMGLMAAVLLAGCCAVLLWLANQVGGHAFMQDVIRMEVLGRMHDASMPPVTFYFTESFGGYAITFPLAILVVLALLPELLHPKGSIEIKFLQKCIAWALIILVGLSIPADKKMRYVLPMAPALALISAYLFCALRSNRGLRILRRVFYGVCFLLPLFALGLIAAAHFKNINDGIHYALLSIVFVVTQCSMYIWRKNSTVVLGIAAAVFYITYVYVVEKINLEINQTRDFVLQVEDLREKYRTPLVFFQEGSDGLPIKYLVNTRYELQPIYLQDTPQLNDLHAHTFVIVGVENFPHISVEQLKHFRVMLKGKIGHDGVVVLEKR